jgi:hypothetical protein
MLSFLSSLSPPLSSPDVPAAPECAVNQHELFIDARVPDLHSVIDAAAPATLIVVLRSDQDGFGQMAAALCHASGLQSISAVSHASASELALTAARSQRAICRTMRGICGLSAVLLQNPRFHERMTSPVGTLYAGMLHQFGTGTVFGPVISTDQRKRLLCCLFDSYDANLVANAEKAVVFDANRMCTAHLPTLMNQFPGAKVTADNFEQISYGTPDFHAPLGMRGLHKVRPAVSLQEREAILPPDLFAQYSSLSFWENTAGSRANVLAVKRQRLNRQPYRLYEQYSPLAQENKALEAINSVVN